MGKDNEIWLAGKAVFLLFFLAFFAAPLLLMLSGAISPGALERLAVLISVNLGVMYNSFFQAVVSVFFALLFGLPAAYVLAKKDFPFRGLVKSLSMLPFVFPSILVVLSFVIVLGNNGWVNSFLRWAFGLPEPVNFLYGFSGVVIAHVFYNFPVVAGLVSSAWESLDSGAEDAARSLGAGKAARFLRITLPQLLPSIAASAMLVFMYCFMSFTIVLSFGGLRFSTLEVEVYTQAMRNLDFASASLLALVQFMLLLAFAGVYWAISRKRRATSQAAPPAKSPLALFSFAGILEGSFILLLSLSVLVPVLSLVLFSFTDPATGGFTIAAFEKVFSSAPSPLGTTPVSAIFYSFAIASGASLVATLMALLASLRETRVKAAAVLLSSSIAVSAITLGLGYYMAFGSGSMLVIALAHSVLAFPFAFFSIRNAVSRLGPEQADSARTLGAGAIGVLRRITVPRISGGMASAFSFSFAVSLGELGIVLMLYDGVYATMPVYIYRLLGTFSVHSAAAMGLILIFSSMACFYAVHLFSKGQWRLA
ncbi:MAG: iron ABC transporter permease [Candidatus Diapherotrites archaeon]|uniref:Iron ABC transporter permease n=1 Tax=Candidatus Iainarchaeum sp. TaxID=3101447 RepID=A0A8T3YJS6_9ARCH|nr:iron ABC transporter permease [Candidatus Diapherotrites archaeon]